MAAIACSACNNPVAAADDDEEVDDVELNECGHHFHWDCFLAHTEPDTHCPACHRPLDSLLATVRTDGGEEHDYDLLPVLREERVYAANPQLRVQEAFFQACFAGDAESVQALLDDPQQSRFLATATDLDKGWTGLFFAAVAGHTEIVRYLLFSKGFDRHARDKFDHVAAEYAAQEGHSDIADLLLM